MTVSRKQTTSLLGSILIHDLFHHPSDPRYYWAREVTFDYASNHPVRVDFMQYKPRNQTCSGIEQGEFLCFEVKSCTKDFHSKHGHNFIGDKNYYVMPEKLFESVKDEIPYSVGCYVARIARTMSADEKSRCVEAIPSMSAVLFPSRTSPGDWDEWTLVCKKRSSRRDRNRSASEMLFMMMRSCGRERGHLLEESEAKHG